MWMLAVFIDTQWVVSQASRFIRFLLMLLYCCIFYLARRNPGWRLEGGE